MLTKLVKNIDRQLAAGSSRLDSSTQLARGFTNCLSSKAHTRTQITAPGVCSYSNGFSKRSAFFETHANIRLYGISDKRNTQWWIFCEVNSVFVNSKQSTSLARPTNLPPAPLSAKCIHPRRDVLLERISQSFSPLRILSSHCFFTTRATFDDRFAPLLLPALFLALPIVAFPPD